MQSVPDPMDKNRGLVAEPHRAHPWHGVDPGPDVPGSVTAYIEIVPTDTVKYEADKVTGILRIDRPQQYSNVCPTLYGFIPRTLCAGKVAAFSHRETGLASLSGDGDPLDVCVLTEKTVTHGDVLVRAIPIGGLRMIDREEADDKIVAVLEGDAAFGALTDLSQVPPALVTRLRHYFLTYKLAPDREGRVVEIRGSYGREDAHEVIRRSREDYEARFGAAETNHAARASRQRSRRGKARAKPRTDRRNRK
jgi:inorganic pyrophosphatase